MEIEIRPASSDDVESSDLFVALAFRLFSLPQVDLRGRRDDRHEENQREVGRGSRQEGKGKRLRYSPLVGKDGLDGQNPDCLWSQGFFQSR